MEPSDPKSKTSTGPDSSTTDPVKHDHDEKSERSAANGCAAASDPSAVSTGGWLHGSGTRFGPEPADLNVLSPQCFASGNRKHVTISLQNPGPAPPPPAPECDIQRGAAVAARG